MAAGDINDPLTNIPNVVVVDQGSASAAPGAGYARLEVVNGVLGVRVDTGSWVPLFDLATVGQINSLTEKATPVDADLVVIEDSAASYAKKKAQLSNLPGGGGGGGLYDAYVCIADEKAQNTNGGTFTSGAWRTRDLNTERADTAGIASLASNQITLPAGTYRAMIMCPTEYVNKHQARLYNITGAAVLLTGMSSRALNTSVGNTSHAIIQGRFTLAVESVLEVQHRCETTNNTYGFGPAVNFTTEVYTVAEFWRETA